MFRYFTKKQSYKYLEMLPKIVTAYNNSYHRGLKGVPAKVTKQNEGKFRVYKRDKGKIHYKFNVGDTVRIGKGKGVFERGYLGNWSGELFKITSRTATTPPTYKLKDWVGEDITSIFYESELQRVDHPEDQVYLVEKVLRTRKTADGKENEHLVKWMYWPDKFNSWEKDSDMKTI